MDRGRRCSIGVFWRVARRFFFFTDWEDQFWAVVKGNISTGVFLFSLFVYLCCRFISETVACNA